MNKLDDLRSSTWRLLLTAHVKLLDRMEPQLTAANLPPLEWYDVLFTIKEAPNQRLNDATAEDVLGETPLSSSSQSSGEKVMVLVPEVQLFIRSHF